MTALRFHLPQSDEPGPSILLKVRAGFTLQGTTLAQWCAEHRVSRTYAIQCLTGKRRGPAALALRYRLLTAALVAA